MAKAPSFEESFRLGYEAAFGPPSIWGMSEHAAERGFTLGSWDKAEGRYDPERAFLRYVSVGEKLFTGPTAAEQR